MKKGILILLSFTYLFAHEGMWLPALLNSLNEDDMKARGLKLTAEDIYSVNQSSLKDAVVHFGGFCTGEIVSNQGLILTNHHCGYSEIQDHSTLENNYLKDGFWAKKLKDELPNEGLYARFLVYMEDVTTAVLEGTNGMPEGERAMHIKSKIDEIIAAKLGANSKYEGTIKAFDYGNVFYLLVTETFHDVRLVGAPPSSVGKYGFDKDNWVWPRHTGDFSVFRIYANKDNEPAYYSEDNVPYQPKKFFKVSLKKENEGDFSMVFGYPGTTEQHLTSFEVNYRVNIGTPAKVDMRDKALEIIDAGMKSSEELKLKYASKQSGIANAWKKWKGQNMGLIRFNVIEQKQQEEAAFMTALKKNKELYKEHSNILSELELLEAHVVNENLAYDVFTQWYGAGPDVPKYLVQLSRIIGDKKSKGISDEEISKSIQVSVRNFLKKYDADIEKALLTEITFKMMEYMFNHQIIDQDYYNNYKDKAALYAKMDQHLNQSLISDTAAFIQLANDLPKLMEKLSADPMVTYYSDIIDLYRSKILSGFGNYQDRKDSLMRVYVHLKRQLSTDKVWYDANSTLRLTYGAVEGSAPWDGMVYTHYTTMDGVMDKYIPGNYEFDLPAKLIELYENKDYGQYADENGEMRVCFTASNHTSGGNSGSPVIDGEGNLIGINFDRSWESTMSDIKFETDICRNIAVDMNYVLFIIDKLGGAKRLIKEMELVK